MNCMCGIVLLAALSLVPISSAAGIRGNLRDELGAAIGNAAVIVFTQRGELLKTSTDATGKYSVEVADGIQDVFATSAGFAPICRKVLVKSGGWTEFSPVLRADPLTIQLRGDTFDVKKKK